MRKLAVVLALAFGLMVSGSAALAAELTATDPTDPVTTDPTDPVEPVHADGWEQSGTAWNYWKDGAKVQGAWVDTDVKPAALGGAAGVHRYWIDANGDLAVGRLVDPAKTRDAAAYYAYATKFGYVATGKTRVVGTSSTRIYLAKATGAQVGQLETGNKYGILRTSAYDKGTMRRYYINPKYHSAVVKNDLSTARPVEVKGFGWVLPCYKGGYLLEGARKVIGQRVYLAKDDGVLQTGNVKVNGKVTSILRTGKYDKGSVRCYYIDPSKHCAISRSKPRVIEVKGAGHALALASKYGQLLAGAKKVVAPTAGTKAQRAAGLGARVYLASANGLLETGNVKVNGKVTSILRTGKYDKGTTRSYYIEPDKHCAVVRAHAVQVKRFGWVLPCNKRGYLATGRRVIGDRVYLARANGKLESGNKLGFLSTKRYDAKGERRRYYIDPKTHAITYGRPVKVANFGYVYAPGRGGYLLTESKRIDSKHILLVEKNGHIWNRKGWLVTSAYSGSLERYWFEPTTKNKKLIGARVGYFKVNGTLYLGQSGGNVLRNTWREIDDNYYWVTDAGKFQKDYVVTRLYRKAQGYSSPSRYLIMVDVDDPQVVVLEGGQGDWRVKFIWDCCTGAPSTPTVTGTFSIGAKGYSFGEGNGYSCYYWTQITGDYLFHSRLYYAYTHTLMAPAMGSRVSHGCVRLYDDAAIWIQNNCPAGTTVACIY